MSLKDDLQEDIGIFLDLDEFGETITLDGNTVEAIVQETPREEFDGGKGDDRPQGVFNRTVILYLRPLPDLPAEGRRIEYNGGRWTVRKVSDQRGVIMLQLEAVDS